MQQSTVRRSVLELTVFLCGAVVMTYEIIGSRVLSPFIGTSTYVWTSLIGVILGSLSLGYWLGGRLADRKPEVRVLALVIFLAGGFIALTVLVKEIALSIIADTSIGIELRSLIASLVLFAPASVCLGIVTPYAVKLRLMTIETAGETVGRLYALSTVGSILGTFVAGFVLIPFIGSVRTLYCLSALLIGLSLLLVPFSISRLGISVFVLLIFSIVSNEVNVQLLRQSSGLIDIDTEYSRVQVFRTVDPKSGKAIQALATDPYFVQSAMFFDSEEPVFEYSKYYRLVRHSNRGFRNVLVIGGAGYSVPKDFLRRYDDVKIDVVEIDPQMTEIASRYFKLESDQRLNIVHEDGRTFLRGAAEGKYDAIMMDAFGSIFSIPYQLTTVEAVRDMNRSLNENGVVIFNLGSAITGPGSKFLQAELATYRAVFPTVLVFKVNSDYTDDRLQNLIIVAVRSTGVPDRTSLDNELSLLLSHRLDQIPPGTEPMITDDLAPVEYYNSIAQNIYLTARR